MASSPAEVSSFAHVIGMTPIHSCIDEAALYVRLITSSCACDGKLPDFSLVNQTLMIRLLDNTRSVAIQKNFESEFHDSTREEILAID